MLQMFGGQFKSLAWSVAMHRKHRARVKPIADDCVLSILINSKSNNYTNALSKMQQQNSRSYKDATTKLTRPLMDVVSMKKIEKKSKI